MKLIVDKIEDSRIGSIPAKKLHFDKKVSPKSLAGFLLPRIRTLQGCENYQVHDLGHLLARFQRGGEKSYGIGPSVASPALVVLGREEGDTSHYVYPYMCASEESFLNVIDGLKA